MRQHIIAVALSLVLPVVAWAGEGVVPLFIGDPAPAIPDIRWVGGDEVRAWEPGHVYVIAGSYDLEKARQAVRVRHRAGVFIGKAAQAERSGEFHRAIDLIERAVEVDLSRFFIYRGWKYEITLALASESGRASAVAKLEEYTTRSAER